MIPITNQTTFFANVLSLGQRLRDTCTTETGLRRTARIDFHQQPTSFFRFVGEHKQKIRPSGIIHGLTQIATSKSFDVQIFNSDKTISIDNLARLFVVEISTLIADVIMKTRKQQYRFTSAVRSSLSSRYTPLQSSQFSFSGSEPTRIVNSRSVAQGSKRIKPNVYPDHIWAERQRLGLAINAEYCIPSPRFMLHGERLHVAIKRAMQIDTHVSNFRKPEFVSVQCITDLPERDAVISLERPKPGIARHLSALDPCKETLKRKVYTLQRIFKNVRVYLRNVRSNLLYLRKLNGLVEIRNRLAIQRPCLPTLLKARIVDFATDSQVAVQCLGLALSGIDPITEGFEHVLFYQSNFRFAPVEEQVRR